MLNQLLKILMGAALLSLLLLFASPSISQGAVTETNKPTQPNILWIVLEDLSPDYLPDYGPHIIETPNISRLAREGIKYTNVYSTSGVCAPSRAAIALGMYPSSVGANHMRTTSNTEETGLPKYEAVPPPEARMLSQYMRALGYYATNNYKEDYQFTAPKNAWDASGFSAYWGNRGKGQPFYTVLNFHLTHESNLFEPYGIRENSKRFYFLDNEEKIATLPSNGRVRTSGEDTTMHLPTDSDFVIPPYLPDTPTVRRDHWKIYNSLAETDRQIGAVLALLEKDGLLDNTIIVFYSDHGGSLPRQKRLIYDSGLKVPLIVRFPDGKNAGTTDDQLISFIDFAPTTLQMAGAAIPEHMHGESFIDETKRKYIHAAADRFDGITDAIRAVKDKRYKYIRNYRPEQAYYLPVKYRENIPTMKELLILRDKGELNEAQMQWFRSSKPKHELFDTQNDPHELDNLANEPRYAEKLAELSQEMDRWLAAVGDKPNYPEAELISELWQGASAKPKTEAPKISMNDNIVTLYSPTQGASIGYRFISSNDRKMKLPIAHNDWQLYRHPFTLPKNANLEVWAHRIGYEQSRVVTLQ